jgi:hypothetical protein
MIAAGPPEDVVKVAKPVAEARRAKAEAPPGNF